MCSEQQQVLLKKVIAMVQRIPTTDDNSWTNTWHWVLSYVGGEARLTARDASCGHLLLSITDGRVSAEMRSAGGLLHAGLTDNRSQLCSPREPGCCPALSAWRDPSSATRPGGASHDSRREGWCPSQADGVASRS
jgi:hypothetical protein